MRARVGDELVVGDSQSGRHGRVGTIVAVQSGGSPPYLVHWLAGYESQIGPGPGDDVEVHRRGGGMDPPGLCPMARAFPVPG